MIPLIAVSVLLLLRATRPKVTNPPAPQPSSLKPQPRRVHHPRVIIKKTHQTSTLMIDEHQIRMQRHRSPFLPPLKNIPIEE